MSLFLTILEGSSPGEARPLLATQDPHIISLVARELLSRLAPGPAPVRVVDFSKKEKPAKDDGNR